MSREYSRHELRTLRGYKKALYATVCTAVLLSGAGCGEKTTDSRINNGSSSVEDVLNQGMDAADSGTDTANDDTAVTPADAVPSGQTRQNGITAGAPAPDITGADGPVLSTTEGVDVDLTILSSTVVYSEVYNMMSLPEEYIGKTIRMEGMFSYYHDDTTGKDYFACIIKDATACCAQGIEFELEGEHKFPDDYPKDGEYVKVEGVFDTYKEGDYEYCTLRNAHML